ncbi:protein kinase domain-containing protein [Trichormus variabilis]|uniref:non-specific serine/threonine protein kinase n=1 Tax=Trichormus variabilis SAG 1403-4b TaxID=447716 RepID=A0A3S1AEY0_ANAVA|nr:serine/threonine-protein kinase [Trichormus variabilis]MBD2625145.1 protein kinase [Trichormus variabilis FACHB-164]RUS99516.1 hypothetical protein DSM107003_01000 [Trichormus variabilis SAG 1403-4b]
MTHNIGDIVNGRYRILEFIGRGGFGETYLVEHINSPGSKFILKYLNFYTTDPQTLEQVRNMFRREAEILRRLGGHDQIPKLSEYFDEDQKFYLVQEYIEGIDILKELENKQHFQEAEVINILCEVLNILQYLEKSGVIHRDIKPANLMRRKRDGKIIMIDFGAVKKVSISTLNAQGQPNLTIIGTHGYMPPEQEKGEQPKYASDIHALGITAIQLLTGKNPLYLSRDSQKEIKWQHLTQVNPDLAKILTKMVCYSLADRYKSAQEVLNALNKAGLTPKQIPPTGISTQIPTTTLPLYPLWQQVIMNKRFLTIIGVFLIIIISILFYKKQQFDRAEQLNADGVQLTNNKRINQAIEKFNEAIKIDKRFSEPWLNRAFAHRQNKQHQEEFSDCQQVINNIDSDNSAAWLCSGNAKQGLKEYQDSIPYFDKAIDLSCYSNTPNLNTNKVCPDAWNNKGESLLNLKRFDDAISAFNMAIDKDIKDAHVTWNNIGRCQLKKSDPTEALEAFNKAIESNKDYVPALLGKGQSLLLLKRPQEALAAFQNAKDIEPNNKEAKEGIKKSLEQLRRSR